MAIIGRCETVSFQSVGPWMDCPFTDLGADGGLFSESLVLIYIKQELMNLRETTIQK